MTSIIQQEKIFFISCPFVINYILQCGVVHTSFVQRNFHLVCVFLVFFRGA
jgi:hypothetical protein